MSLTGREIRNIAPSDKIQRYFGERGLNLEIAPKGGKWWRFKYRFSGKEKRLSVGEPSVQGCFNQPYRNCRRSRFRQRFSVARRFQRNGAPLAGMDER